jgi:hypothetical protein
VYFPDSPVLVTITVEADDAYHPGTRGTFGLKREMSLHQLDLIETTDYAVHWIWNLLRELSCHEDEEWFKVAGRRPFAPHAARSR